jgi:endonuclease I
MKKIITILFAIPSFVFAQIPTGYYNAAQGLSGDALKVALHNIIDNHTVISYNNLHDAYFDTDKMSTGKVWDIYSDVPGGTAAYYYSFNSGDQCGSYAVEGDCYNREHTWPQSWFSSSNGPQSDLFHVMPTDGKVNGERGNYPYGDVEVANYTSTNGSKLGFSVSLGFSGAVFEPIDEYKGDLARNYFYMSTRYYTEDAAWSTSAATNKSTILPWQLNVLLTWHHNDPVSTKEINRNNVIYYDYQNNRNPFIDHPEWADSIWAETVEAFISSVGTEELNNQEITVYPNPFEEELFVTLVEYVKLDNIQFFDNQGKIVDIEMNIENSKLSLNTSKIEKGIYFLRLKDMNQVIRIVKI